MSAGKTAAKKQQTKLARALEICEQLGLSKGSISASKETAQAFHDEISSAAVTFGSSQGPEPTILRYLNQMVSGARRNPFVFDGYATIDHLSLPNDYHRVKELIMEFFDLMSSAENETEEACDQDSSSAISESPRATQHAAIKVSITEGPLARFAHADSKLVGDLIGAGFNEDMPKVFNSEEHMIKSLELWMKINPSLDPPGSSTLNEAMVLGQEVFLTPTFATTAEHVHIQRLKISDRHMGWIMNDRSDYCMYVSRMPSDNDESCRFVAWKGGNEGFTATAIAAMEEQDDSTQDNDKFTLKEVLPEVPKKKEPNPFEPCRPSLRQKKYVGDIERALHKEEKDLLAKCDEAQSSNRLQQHEFPTRKSARQAEKRMETLSTQRKSALPRHRKEFLIPDSGAAQFFRELRTNSEESVKRNGAYESNLPASKRLCTDDPNSPPRNVRFSLPSPPPTPSKAKQAEIEFFFFTAHEELGAIPATFQQCNTFKPFFDRAFQAQCLLLPDTQESDVMAVNAIIDGLAWPLILPWRQRSGFDGMKERLTSMSSRTDETINVRVKCITQM